MGAGVGGGVWRGCTARGRVGCALHCHPASHALHPPPCFSQGCHFIATNTDARTHLTDAQEWAGNGAMVGAIKGATRTEPTVVGKPAEFMLADIAKKFGLKRSQARERMGGGRVVEGGVARRGACPPTGGAHPRPPPHRPTPPTPPTPTLAPQICMVGDRLDTDILFGSHGGLTTMLVLSGVTTESALLSPDNAIHPNLYTDALPDLLAVKSAVAA